MGLKMYKLYQKNELNFALFWILIYCLLAVPILGKFGETSIVLFLFLVFFAFAISYFIKKYKLCKKYGLDHYPQNTKRFLYFIPVWILATGNLWGGFSLSYRGFAQVLAVLSMVLIAYIEEIIFRGFLFKALLAKEGTEKAIIIVGITFGLGHIVNLFAGQASFETLVQIVFAIAWGFILVIIFYKSKSLIPSIIAHGFINAFSKFGIENPATKWLYIILTITVAICYCYYLINLDNNDTKFKV